MKLDVGCGKYPRGDVNCDINTYENPQIHDSSHFVDVKKIPNFVQCDAQYLPFRDKAFEETNCSHVIEHVVNPYRLLKELIRVTNGEITIRCPYRFVPFKKLKYHLYFFDVNWFKTSLSSLNVDFSICISYYSPVRSFKVLRTMKLLRFLYTLMERLSIPWEIRVKIKS